MTAETYRRISAPFRSHAKGVNLANRVLTYLCYVLYPALLVGLAVQRDGRFWQVLLSPAVGFVVLTLFRSWVNAPRPYEVLDIDPLIHKDTKGHSFPSRHVYSVFAIAAAWLYVIPPVGALFLLLGCLLAVIRVIAGVHFPRDVLAGAAIGLLTGVVGYLLLAG